MTVFGRDMSDFDTNESVARCSFVTHKATEGTTTIHLKYGPRLNRYRQAGVPVLGSYHMVRTPGNHGNGSLQAQLNYWVARMDNQTPWWRAHPNFILQVDAEVWPYDAVSASTVLAFARLLADSGLPGWKVLYASRGQYGDALRGSPLPLWNANYTGGPNYPGDSAIEWNAYSGQKPTLLQYTDTPYDKDAFRGTLDELLALTGGTDMAWTDDQIKNLMYWAENTARVVTALGVGDDTFPYQTSQGTPQVTLTNDIKRRLVALAPDPVTGLTDAQLAALEQAIVAAVTTHHDALTAADGPVIREAVRTVLQSVTA
jgi:hypothetical protein